MNTKPKICIIYCFKKSKYLNTIKIAKKNYRIDRHDNKLFHKLDKKNIIDILNI